MKAKKDTIIGAIAVIIIILLIGGITSCSSSSSTSSSSSSESRNKCGDTNSEHFAKTRKCNAKDNEKQNCTYSNCQCTCRPR